jgi:hypothetical protein
VSAKRVGYRASSKEQTTDGIALSLEHSDIQIQGNSVNVKYRSNIALMEKYRNQWIDAAFLSPKFHKPFFAFNYKDK